MCRAQAIGPNFGYYPKPSMTWLVEKPEYLERAKEQLHGINITDQCKDTNILDLRLAVTTRPQLNSPCKLTM